MKINYNGQELETITEGYWPEGTTLLYGDSPDAMNIMHGVVCLRSRKNKARVLLENGAISFLWKHWAIMPSKPATRRLTNREVGELCKNGWDVCVSGLVGSTFWYKIDEDDIAIEGGKKLRAPGSDEWVEPTTELLEVEK